MSGAKQREATQTEEDDKDFSGSRGYSWKIWVFVLFSALNMEVKL